MELMINYLYEKVIPPCLKQDIYTHSIAKNIVGTAIITFVASPTFALLYWYIGHAFDALLILLDSMCAIFIMLILRISGSIKFARESIVVCLNILLVWVIFQTGGLYSNVTFFLLLPAFLAILLGSLFSGLIWCVLNNLIVIYLYFITPENFTIANASINHIHLYYLVSIIGLNLIVTFFAAFTESRKQESFAKLDYLAYHDPLTGIDNRVRFHQKYTTMLLEIDASVIFYQIFFDVDNFKIINDTFGHEAGDLYLIEVVRRISSCLSSQDIFARLGGDEFSIVLNPKRDYKIIVDDIYASLKKPIYINSKELYISISMGISKYPEHGIDASTLTRNADIAQYQAKKMGKNISYLFAEESGLEMARQLSIEIELTLAIKNNEFYLYFQPIFSAADVKRLVGVEVLIRWKNKKLGEVSPAEFIPIAEKLGFIKKIDEFVFDTAIKQLRRWLDENIFPEDLKMSINISGDSFQNDKLIVNLNKSLQEHKIDPKLIQLEVTETALMKNSAQAQLILSQMKEKRISLAIDDFGKGYSSLNYLQKLDISTLKIDMSFIKDITTVSSSAVLIIRTIINLAKSLNLVTVAEGVENDKQLDVLQKLECDHLQGFFLSKPLSKEDFENLLKQST